MSRWFIEITKSTDHIYQQPYSIKYGDRARNGNKTQQIKHWPAFNIIEQLRNLVMIQKFNEVPLQSNTYYQKKGRVKKWIEQNINK